MPKTTIVEIPLAEQAQMLAEVRGEIRRLTRPGGHPFLLSALRLRRRGGRFGKPIVI